MKVHHSTALAGSLGVVGLHAAHGRGVKVFQVSGAVTLPTASGGQLLDLTNNFAVPVVGQTTFLQGAWGFSTPRVAGPNTITSFSAVFPNGVILQDLDINGIVPTAADWYVFYEDIG